MSVAIVGRVTRVWGGGFPRTRRPADATVLDADKWRPRAGMAVAMLRVAVSVAERMLAWLLAAWELPTSVTSPWMTLAILRKWKLMPCTRGRRLRTGKRRHLLG